MSTETLTVTQRTRLRRTHQRGRHDRESIYAILDATPLCHVGYLLDGKPAVTPTIQWREGDHVYWHGSSASRALRSSTGLDVCLTVSLIDGMVLARSAFHHSANYRSVMIYGEATKITDVEEKTEKLRGLVEALYPGRWNLLRPMTAQEVKATTILSLPIEEASAKIRTGGPVDDEPDYALPIWAGVVPIRQVVDAPDPDPRNIPDLDVPTHVTNFTTG